MTLEELNYKENLSVRSYNLCKNHELLDLASIQAFYQRNNSFRKLRNCGEKSNRELTSLCKKYDRDGSELIENDLKNPLLISLKELYQIHLFTEPRISKKTYAFCQKNNFQTVEDILTFCGNHEFRSKRSGIEAETRKELRRLSKTYLGKYADYQKYKRIDRSERLNLLNETQKQLVTHFINTGALDLSVRGNNALFRFLDADLDFRNFRDKILSNPGFDVYNMSNVGAKTSLELQRFIESVEAFASKVSEMQGGERANRLKNKLAIQFLFPKIEIPKAVLESNAILTYVEYLIESQRIFQGKRDFIFQNGFHVYSDQPAESMRSIADKMDITRERVRQIRREILDVLIDKFGFIKEFQDSTIQRLDFDFHAPTLWINREAASRINAQYNTRLSAAFLTLLFGIITSDSFTLLGLMADVLVYGESINRNRHNWQKLYLVNNRIIDKIDFNELLNHLDSRASEKIDTTITLKYTGFLAPFIRSNPGDRMDEISELTARIIRSEFEADAVSIKDGWLYLHKNTAKLATDYAYEALDALGKPSHTDDVAQKAMELNPGYITSGDQLRAAMQREPEFVPIGRTGIYGLVKWEAERENFKGGTIRKIVEEFLVGKDTPIAIERIAEYVLKYRPKSNQPSISQNLKLDQHNIFTFYKNSKVGLKSKKYADYFEELTDEDKVSVRTWDEQFHNLKTFLSIHKRLPQSRPKTKEEVRLYRWWRKQYEGLRTNKLSAERAKKMAVIVSKYYPESKRKKRNVKPDSFKQSKSRQGGEDSSQYSLFGDNDF